MMTSSFGAAFSYQMQAGTFGFSPAMGAGFGRPGLPFGGGFPGLDGFSASAGLMDLGGGGFPMGGLGPGMANPMMAMGAMGQTGPQDMQMMMMLLALLMKMGGSQGMGGPMNGAGFGGPQGPGGFGGPQGPGFGQGQQGGEIELQKGQTFTTPSGSTISWKGDEVKVQETGGGGRSMGAGGCCGGGQGGGSSFAGALAGPGFAMAFAGASAGVGGCCGCCCGSQQNNAKPRNWRVWGDPHIDHPNGSKSDFDRKNAIFTLQDGTKVLMGADNPKGVVQSVKIFLPGTPVNMQGYDPNQTSVMQDRNGKFESVGTAAQFMQGGFQRPF